MATIKPAPHISDIRGSMGNSTYSHNKSGIYLKQRVAPRYSATIAQINQRNLHQAGVARWKNTLSPSQRAAWNNLGLLTSWLNPIGTAYTPSGFSLFMRAWDTVRGNLYMSCDAPPTAAAAPPPTLTWTATHPSTPYLASDSGWSAGKTGMLFYSISMAVPASRYSWFGPWQSVGFGSIAALTAAMPTSLYSSALSGTAGQHFAVRIVAAYANPTGPTICWPQHFLGTIA